MSANGRLTSTELTLVQRGTMNIYLANVAARAWTALKAEYDRAHPGESLTIAAPVGGYRSYSVQADMHVNPSRYGLSAYSTIPIAPAGYSTHGDGMAVDIAGASLAGPRKTWLLKNASRFGFTRQFGDRDPNHYRHDGTTAASITPTPIKEKKIMATNFVDTSTYKNGAVQKGTQCMTVWEGGAILRYQRTLIDGELATTLYELYGTHKPVPHDQFVAVGAAFDALKGGSTVVNSPAPVGLATTIDVNAAADRIIGKIPTRLAV
jgi:D-alanyl-D-alanine carboxypeptidase.